MVMQVIIVSIVTIVSYNAFLKGDGNCVPFSLHSPHLSAEFIFINKTKAGTSLKGLQRMNPIF